MSEAGRRLRAQHALMAALSVILAAVLTGAVVSTGQAQPVARAPRRAVSCYWQPHPRTHEAQPWPAVLTEVRHSVWLIMQPRCGLVPLGLSLSRCRRLVFGALHDRGVISFTPRAGKRARPPRT